ncbi:MAG: Flp pilus assembly protein CpaB [Planctomycetaceae bacterium]
MTAAIFAILVGLGGAYMVRQYLHKPEVVVPEVTSTDKMLYIPIANAELQPGREVRLSDITILTISEKQRATHPMLKKTGFMGDARQIVGRVLQTPVGKYETFHPENLFPEGMTPGVTELLKPGYRAVTIPIKNVGAVAGYARPGSHVDVLFRTEANQRVKDEVTMTLLERVQVLAVNELNVPGEKVDLSDDGTVTLGVTPEQAKALKVVEGRGELSLTLRMPDDDSAMVGLSAAHRNNNMTLEQLIGARYMRRTSTMEVFHGGQKQVHTFDNHVLPNESSSGFISTPIASDDSVFPPIQRIPGRERTTSIIESGAGGESGGGESGGGGS